MSWWQLKTACPWQLNLYILVSNNYVHNSSILGEWIQALMLGNWWQLMTACWWQLMTACPWQLMIACPWQLMTAFDSWWLLAHDGWWQLMTACWWHLIACQWQLMTACPWQLAHDSLPMTADWNKNSSPVSWASPKTSFKASLSEETWSEKH